MSFPTMWYVGPAKPQISLCYTLEYSMTVKLLTEHHLEFLSLKGDSTCSRESTLVKMPHCWNVKALLIPEGAAPYGMAKSCFDIGVSIFNLCIFVSKIYYVNTD